MIKAEILLNGYANAVFPMADGKNGKINWYSADPRGIIDLFDYHIPKRLMRYIKNADYSITFDQFFDKVIKNCSIRPKEQGIWISDEIIESYINLHLLGFAHSVEVYVEEKLIAGLYGVALKGAFFGESMFNFPDYPNMSKIALYHLIQKLKDKKFILLDIQMITTTTKQFGAKLISKSEYIQKLHEALQIECKF